LNFGEVETGEFNSMELKIQNTGSADLNISNLGFKENSGFNLVNAIEFPLVIPPMEIFDIMISFSPVSVGLNKDTLLIESDAGESPNLKIPLKGTGINPPDIILEPEAIEISLDADILHIDTVVIRNSGQGILSYSIVLNKPWLIVNPSQGSLSAGQSDTILVSISTNGMGTGIHLGNLQFWTNIPNTEKQIINLPVKLNITGNKLINVLPLLKFPDVKLNSPHIEALEVMNIGTDTLTIFSASTNNTVFNVLTELPFIIAPGKKASIEIQFTPYALTNFSGILTINSDDQNTPQVETVLSGKGILPQKIDLSHDTIKVSLESASERIVDLIVKNEGNEDLNYFIELDNASVKCLSLDGNGDYVNILNSPHLTPKKELSIQAWIYPEKNSNQYIIGKENTGDVAYRIRLDNAGKLNFTINNNYSISSNKIIPERSWSHVAAVFNGYSLQVFVDGIMENELTIPDQEVNEIASNIKIGRSAANEYFQGMIDEFAIWSTARSESEMASSFFQSLLGNESGLSVYYDFNSNQGNIIFDGSSHNNLGTLYGNAGLISSTLDLNQMVSLNNKSGNLKQGENQKTGIGFAAGQHFSHQYLRHLFVSSNDPENPELTIPLIIDIVGEGILSSSVNTLEFEDVFAGYSDTLSVTFLNNGGKTLYLKEWPIKQPHFSAIDTFTFLSPFSQLNCRIVFHPKSSGELIRNIVFFIESLDQPVYQLECKGIGIDPPVFKASSTNLSFGEIPIGESHDSILIISNEGSSELVIDSIGFNSLPEMILSSQSPFTINPGEVQNFTITLSPKSYSIYENELVFYTNIGMYRIPVSGKGTNANIDMALTKIISVENGCNLSSEVPVTVMIQNFGLTDANDFNISFRVNNRDWILETYEGDPISPGDSLEYTFNGKADLSLPGINDFFCKISFSGDQYLLNDSLRKSVNNYQELSITTSPPASICQGETIEIKAVGALNYSWSNGSTSDIIEVSPVQTTTYFVNASDNYGCTATDSVKITVNPKPPIPLIIPEVTGSICDGNTVLLNSDLSLSEEDIPNRQAIRNSLIYQWKLGSLTLVSGYDTTYSAGTGGKYYLVVRDLNDCSTSSEPYTLEVIQKAQLTNPPIYNACNDQPFGPITLSSSQSGTVFSWNATSGEGVGGYVESGTEIIPVTTYHLNSSNADTVFYTIENQRYECVGNSSIIGVVVNPFLEPEKISEIIPDNANNLSFPVTLSWSPSEGALSYDLYLWKTTDPKPINPNVANLTSISYKIMKPNSFVDYGNSYYWSIVAHNHCGYKESDLGTFQIRKLPDITVTDIQVSDEAFSGQKLALNWIINNAGPGNTYSAFWSDAVFLSTDSTLEIGIDKELKSYGNFSSLDSGQKYNQYAEVTLPNGIDGEYYIFIHTDRFDQLEEINDENNILGPIFTRIYLTPPPDLQVNSIISPFNAFSGEGIDVSWEVKNLGQGSTVYSNWYDAVYLSNEEIFDKGNALNLGTFLHSGLLKPDSGYIVTKSFYLPNEINGKYYIYIITDSENGIYEHASETNNTEKGDPIQVTLNPPADLALTNIDCYGTVFNNEAISLSWTVQNQGIGSAFGSWYDAVFFSVNSIFNKSDAIQIFSKKHSGELLSDKSYSVSEVLTVPEGISGQAYIYVVCDNNSQIFEGGIKDNNVLKIPVTILTPNITIKNLNHPDMANSGDTLSVEFTIENIGDGKLLKKEFNQALYISLNPNFKEIESTKIADFSISDTFETGQERTFTKKVILPNGIFGNFYVFFKADILKNIYELNEDDNFYVSDTKLEISLSPYPNLIPIEITPETSQITAGQEAYVSYKVKNDGTQSAKGNWVDKVYISDKQYLDDNAIPLFENSVNLNLAPNGSYSIDSLSVHIPRELDEGKYYLFVHIDANSNIYEYNKDGDNLLSSYSVDISAFPPSDLVVFSFSAPDTVWSGENMSFETVISNNSDYITKANFWTDAIYLSENELFEPQKDLLLGKFIHNEPLPERQSYELKKILTIPNGISGPKHLLFITDNEKINNELITTNNLRSKELHIKLTPPVDFEILDFKTDFQAKAGQPVNFSLRVRNIGLAEPSRQWQTRIYLSNDSQIDQNDPVIYSIETQPGFLVGDSYTLNDQCYLPKNTEGYQVLIVFVNVFSNPYEENINNNQMISTIQVNKSESCDFTINQIEFQEEILIGGELSVSYTLVNDGLNPASGKIEEAAYLSADSIWDVNDMLLGSKSFIINLSPGGSIIHTIKNKVTSAKMGEHFVFISTDLKDGFNETNKQNNIIRSTSTINVKVPEIGLNTTTIHSFTNNSEKYFKLIIPKEKINESLMLAIRGDTLNGNNEIYIRKNEMPSKSTYDFGSFTPFKGYQRIIIPQLSEGEYYISIKGNNTTGTPQNIEIENQILDFQVLSLSPNFGGKDGEVSIIIDGSKFSDSTKISLYRKGQVITPDTTILKDVTRLYASFNLNNASLGEYDLIARNPNEEKVVLKSAFFVQEKLPIDFQINVIRPGHLFQGGITSITIEYYNGGNTNIYNPSIDLSTESNPFSLSVKGLKNNDTSSLSVEIGEQIADKRVLPPGKRGSIVCYMHALKKCAVYIETNQSK
jgi:hypothetical protein